MSNNSLELLLSVSRHFMIDIETTGLVVYQHAITSMAYIEFTYPDFQPVADYETRVHIPQDKCLDVTTMAWREEHDVNKLENQIGNICTRRGLLAILRSFIDMECFIWAKPTTFDIAFLAQYYADLEQNPPWNYRRVMDCASFAAARGFIYNDLIHEAGANLPEVVPHVALNDCLIQLNALRLMNKGDTKNANKE